MKRIVWTLGVVAALATGCNNATKKAEEAKAQAAAQAAAAATEAKAQADARAAAAAEAFKIRIADAQHEATNAVDAAGRKGDYLVGKFEKLSAAAKKAAEPMKAAYEQAKRTAADDVVALASVTASSFDDLNTKLKTDLAAVQKSVEDFEAAVTAKK